MLQLSVGYVAGIIAAGIFVARIWAPNTITFIISALLRDQASASTWTVASRALARSHWPDILRSDVTINRGVRKDILVLSKLMGVLSVLIGIAGIVTPLGLYQTLLPAVNVETPFKYLLDSSPFGFGTPPRSSFTFNRICSDRGFAPRPCPFTDTISIITDFPNGTINWDYPSGIDIQIPNFLKDAFTSGTTDTTISNFFDIQWRRYITTSNNLYNNATEYLTGSFRNIQTLIMDNSKLAVEGLVVDAEKGSIGFRNHTVPPGFKHGVTWKEDILFIEPETACVDTNLTIDFTISSTNNTLVQNIVLTDRGGFANLNQTYPALQFFDPQKDPQLYQRAYKAAWLQNAYTMLYYNVTNPSDDSTGTKAFSYLKSEVGKTFPVDLDGRSKTSDFDSLGLTGVFGDYLGSLYGGSLAGTVTNVSDPTANVNPFGINNDNFTSINLLCSGSGSGDLANITNILVNCGALQGVPQRTSPGSSLVYDRGSSWSQKLFTCASVVKANIKEVSFNFNGTDDSTKTLAITGIDEKTYANNTDMPLWGVENTGDAYTVLEANLIWGLLSANHENHPNISTVRQPSLYLPGWINNQFSATSASASDSTENIPASDFSKGALMAAYCVSSPAAIAGCTSFSGQDYSGATSMAMWARWQNLTKSAETAAIIPNLIWADTAASMVVGTKGVLGPGNTGQRNLMPLPVTPTVQQVRYHWPYIIPAALTLVILLAISITALLVTCFRGLGISRMRVHLQQVSPGRIYTTFLFPQPGGMTMKTKEWSRSLGKQRLDLAGDTPSASGMAIEIPEKRPSVGVYEHAVSDTVSEEGQILMNPRRREDGTHGDGSDLSSGFAQPGAYPGYLNQYSHLPQRSLSPDSRFIR